MHIVRGAIDVIEQQFGCKAADLQAVIGPSIGPDSFQVGEEVAMQFKDAGRRPRPLRPVSIVYASHAYTILCTSILLKPTAASAQKQTF
ncbi:MAG: laccase domain-containing protein [Bacteroidales bacterium]|nr:laccase domain-containing protein [Bacteroidales bacterium]